MDVGHPTMKKFMDAMIKKMAEKNEEMAQFGRINKTVNVDETMLN